MNTRKALSVVLVLAFLFTMLSAPAGTLAVEAGGGPPLEFAANYPWTDQELIAGEAGISNLSTVLAGEYHVPYISYSKSGQNRIYQAHLGTSAVPGNCGLNDSWYCTSWNDSDLVAGKVSNMAMVLYPDTFSIKWAYVTSAGMIRGASVEMMHDMSFVGDNMSELLEIGKFGTTVVSAPSIDTTNNRFQMAVLIRDNQDIPLYQLVYLHYTGSTNTSCLSAGSGYQCDVIDSMYGNGNLGGPSFQISGDGVVGIAYYKSGVVKYAYPHEDSPLLPSNCGPGGDTWRCITIFSGTAEGTVGMDVKLTMGDTDQDRGIAFLYEDQMYPLTLFHADYVGNDGNCGEDHSPIVDPIYRWQCEDIVYFYLPEGQFPSFSLVKDADGFSVIAYDWAESDGGPISLYIAYPKMRVGSVDPDWIAQEIDYVPNPDVALGGQAAITLGGKDIGFIAYLHEMPYEPDDLKFALQLQHKTFLPNILR